MRSSRPLAALFALALPVAVHAADAPAQSLPRATPESQGVSSAGVADFLAAADKEVIAMHSFMLVRHGKVVAECWWKPQTPATAHVMFSLSKSFTSTAVGLAIAEGKFTLDDPVLKFFPEDAPSSPSENLKAMKVRHLLSMSAGHEAEPNMWSSKNWIKTFLAHPVPKEPGTFFKYNTPATFMLSAIVQKTTGKTVVEYLQPRLFDPLGIPKPRWDANPQGITLGGYGLFIPTEAIAKFGQLYLQKGMWGGHQVVPANWVAEATSKQVPNGSNPKSDWNQGYGYQFWRSRHGAFRGDGKDGQFCIVLPEHDAVIAITADTGDMQKPLNLIWEKLLPALQPSPLPESAGDQAKLTELCKNLVAKERPKQAEKKKQLIKK
ncbi:MAG TPA: serine hydrolase [Planctomycetia bacterium]|nr:serine hydrolase [Planctomycetia bacterium]